MQAASHQQFTGIYHAISAKVRHWAACGLSFLGKVHVAKQVLAASLWYHTSFQRPSEQLLKRQLRRFVASTLRFVAGHDPGKVWCQLLAVLSLICIVWHTVCSVEIVARRRVRLPSCVLFFGEKLCVSLVDLGKTRR